MDPFQSAAASPVGSGQPVTVFTPLLEQGDQSPLSGSSQALRIEAVYYPCIPVSLYPWTPGDHPSAFAQADVIDSRTALATLDQSQATVPGGGEAVIGEATAILVQLAQPVCAVSWVEVTQAKGMIEVNVYGVTDVTRCGAATTGGWVPVRLTEEQAQTARQSQASPYYSYDQYKRYDSPSPGVLRYDAYGVPLQPPRAKASQP